MAGSGRKFVKGGVGNPWGSTGSNRRQLITMEIISQLNEMDPSNPKRTLLNRLVKNLIAQATYAFDIRVKGKVVEGHGDLSAIKEIIDRIEGKPAQRIMGPDDGPAVVMFNTPEEVMQALLSEGIDIKQLPAPLNLDRSQYKAMPSDGKRINSKAN